MQDITKNSVFVIYPYRPQYKDVVHLAIKPAIEEAGYKPVVADGKEGGAGIIYDDIREKIYQSVLCIADLSKKYDKEGNEIDRGNVIHEITAAWAIGRKIIVLCHDPEEDLPYDMRHLRSITYRSDDLTKLKEDLLKEIRLKTKEEAKGLFPQVRFWTQELNNTLEELKRISKKIKVEVYPPIADIFFNDKLIGASPQTIYVNTEKTRNTLSIAAPSYLEEHRVLTEKDYKNGKIKINLEKTPLSERGYISEYRVHMWMSNRRKDPKNPVLMRAVAQFFNRYAKRFEEKNEVREWYRTQAKEELKELLEVAPGWYMAHNQVGVYYARVNSDLALRHYQVATALNPDNYLGYFNQACAYARKGVEDKVYYDKVWEMLQAFLENPKVLESYSYSNMRLKNDEAFNGLKKKKSRKKRFNEMVGRIDNLAYKLIEKREK